MYSIPPVFFFCFFSCDPCLFTPVKNMCTVDELTLSDTSPLFHPFSCILDTGTPSSVSRICLISPVNQSCVEEKLYLILTCVHWWRYYDEHYTACMFVVLTDCAAFLQHQLYRPLPVLHPEVEHSGLTLYDVSGGGGDGTKSWRWGWRRRGGRRRRGGGRNCTSWCCVGCFWLAGRSVHAGLAGLAGEVAVQK